MAESAQIKQYLAYWFQLGKRIIIPSQNTTLLPTKIFHGDSYSSEFEDCWTLVTNKKNGDCYLESTDQTIGQLLSAQWDITNCARCSMPVPIIQLGLQNDYSCVCDDLDNWPNNQLPHPRSPVNNRQKLTKIKESLNKKSDY